MMNLFLLFYHIWPRKCRVQDKINRRAAVVPALYMDLILFNERKIDRKNQAGYTKSKKVKRIDRYEMCSGRCGIEHDPVVGVPDGRKEFQTAFHIKGNNRSGELYFPSSNGKRRCAVCGSRIEQVPIYFGAV
jgi:hypothetical protein